MEIEVAEASDGVLHVIVIYQEGSPTAENLTGYTTADMAVTSLDFLTVHDTISITITDAANGVLNYLTSVLDTIPTVTVGQREKRLKAQIKITGTGKKDLTRIFDYIVTNDISN